MIQLYVYVYALPLGPPMPPQTTHLGHHRAPSWAPCAIAQHPTSYPFYTWECIYVKTKSLISSHPSFPPSMSTHLFSTSAFLFVPCKYVHLYYFYRFHIYALIYGIRFSLSDLLHSVWQTLGPSNLYKWPNFISFYGWVIFHYIYVPHLLYPFICWWTFRLFPCPGYCK